VPSIYSDVCFIVYVRPSVLPGQQRGVLFNGSETGSAASEGQRQHLAAETCATLISGNIHEYCPWRSWNDIGFQIFRLTKKWPAADFNYIILPSPLPSALLLLLLLLLPAPLLLLMNLFPLHISSSAVLVWSRLAQWYSAGLRAGWSGFRGPVGAGNFSPHHRLQTDSGAHPAPIHWVPEAIYLGFSWVVKLTTNLHLMPRSRMRGAIPPLPQYAFMAWCSVKAQGQLSLPLPYLSNIIPHLGSYPKFFKEPHNSPPCILVHAPATFCIAVTLLLYGEFIKALGQYCISWWVDIFHKSDKCFPVASFLRIFLHVSLHVSESFLGS
jgi:hypothetical protein